MKMFKTKSISIIFVLNIIKIGDNENEDSVSVLINLLMGRALTQL